MVLSIKDLKGNIVLMHIFYFKKPYEYFFVLTLSCLSFINAFANALSSNFAATL